MLPICLFPNPVLRKPSIAINTVDDSLRSLLDDMVETMYDAPGIGLAAPQIGKNIRAVVIDISEREDAEESERDQRLLKIINPVIIAHDIEKVLSYEGCLSLPDHFADIPRYRSVTVLYLDENGQKKEIEAEGILAMCLQHEIDHLDGVLFIDHLSILKRNMIVRKMKKTSRLHE